MSSPNTSAEAPTAKNSERLRPSEHKFLPRPDINQFCSKINGYGTDREQGLHFW